MCYVNNFEKEITNCVVHKLLQYVACFKIAMHLKYTQLLLVSGIWNFWDIGNRISHICHFFIFLLLWSCVVDQLAT